MYIPIIAEISFVCVIVLDGAGYALGRLNGSDTW